MPCILHNMQLEIPSTLPPRANAKALRIMANAAEMVVCSADADPQVKAALANLQAQMESAATAIDLELQQAA